MEAAKTKREWCCFICFSVLSNLNRVKRPQGASAWERFVSGWREHEEDRFSSSDQVAATTTTTT
ncbi:hypothetical protein QJS10_CPB13g01511 [Acorus calamus]|uniref:Uncharacterized protein n=1 Tax=Acorus calamus TaxID=4465 RepID=A0AAV9DI08_ACOCL|nr:hypothetical protein QJS10_CPB13g01511 [Acorus calamus]